MAAPMTAEEALAKAEEEGLMLVRSDNKARAGDVAQRRRFPVAAAWPWLGAARQQCWDTRAVS